MSYNLNLKLKLKLSRKPKSKEIENIIMYIADNVLDTNDVLYDKNFKKNNEDLTIEHHFLSQLIDKK